MSMKIYRKRPGEDAPRDCRATVVTINSDDVDAQWLDDQYPFRWPECRCPDCRREGS
ncbi:hypothetical protein [Streptomyces zagrosensis]|uniref:Uncharacterized protein n=1 Tax=Streptomyces zagrosensis TaxID=1042984 RepID=A0A7W9Q6L9_9ACTN|nr:hypothetical protein [Streptomyces zagrosensis]MBB5934595.1 hypothetical protein [Streptomyces zagrosensis]